MQTHVPYASIILCKTIKYDSVKQKCGASSNCEVRYSCNPSFALINAFWLAAIEITLFYLSPFNDRIEDYVEINFPAFGSA